MQTILETSQLIELRGADAAPFAQSQFMSDVVALANGQWQWSGALNAKGRVIAFFALYRAASDRLLLWLPDGGGEALQVYLQRFVFRSKVSVRLIDELVTMLQFGKAAAHGPDDIRLEFPVDAAGTDRRLLIVPAHRRSTGEASSRPDDAIVSRWQLADMALGVPYIAAGAPSSEKFVPQWLSLERLHAYSLKKGCYPGQEIVARMHYLGQSKRTGFLLTGEGLPPAAMTPVLDTDGKTAGEIVWSLPARAGWSALAVLGKDTAGGAGLGLGLDLPDRSQAIRAEQLSSPH